MKPDRSLVNETGHLDLLATGLRVLGRTKRRSPTIVVCPPRNPLLPCAAQNRAATVLGSGGYGAAGLAGAAFWGAAGTSSFISSFRVVRMVGSGVLMGG
jgi:hypothetical protein